MPRKRKPDKELTTSEAVKRLFPKKVIREAKLRALEASKKWVKPKGS